MYCREKEKEEKRREMAALSNLKRSSSRIETLKKSQEEKDRMLAIQVDRQYIEYTSYTGR